jgi:hypothetical protein
MKLTDTELCFAHDTWSGYNGMLRQDYAFGDRVVSFSGYPAAISSTDDFYITSDNLAITETTQWHPEQHSVPVHHTQPCVYPWACGVGGQTTFLNTHKHWPSFNTPYYEEIYVLSGFYQADKESYGLLSYTNYSRGKIFPKMQGQIQNETAMWYMMRYNDFQADPDSFIPWCSPAGPYNCSGNTQGASLIVGPANLVERDNDGEVEAGDHHQRTNRSPTACLRL